MIKTILTPSHPNAFKPLLDEPFTSTFNHATTKRTLLSFKRVVTNMELMSLNISLNLLDCF
jgi:hypothetical protein